MSDFRDSAAFARLVAVFVDRANAQGWPIDAAGAVVLLANRISRVATLTRRSPSRVVRDYHPRDVIAFVDANVGANAELGAQTAWEDSRLVPVQDRLFAGLTADLASVAQLAAHNGDLNTVNLAADALRSLASSSRDGLAQVDVPAHALHLAQAVLVRARRGIGNGWWLRFNETPSRVAELLDSMDDGFEHRFDDVTVLLGTLA